jgi:hypothetical protein
VTGSTISNSVWLAIKDKARPATGLLGEYLQGNLPERPVQQPLDELPRGLGITLG